MIDEENSKGNDIGPRPLNSIDRFIGTANNVWSLCERINGFLAKNDPSNAQECEKLLMPWKQQSIQQDKEFVAFLEKTRQTKLLQMHQAMENTAEIIRSNPNTTPSALIAALSNTSSLLTGAFVANAVVTIFDGMLTRETLRKGFANVEKTLNQGFEHIDATFRWGFGELMWRLDDQRHVNEEIKSILEKPMETLVKEWRKKAIEWYNFGWYDEALKGLQEALDKAIVDHICAQYIGNICLFHNEEGF